MGLVWPCVDQNHVHCWLDACTCMSPHDGLKSADQIPAHAAQHRNHDHNYIACHGSRCLSVLSVFLWVCMSLVLLYGGMAGNDAWNMFAWTFKDVKQILFKFDIVNFRYLYRYMCIYIYIYI